jgi:hypothetical protein
MSEQCEVCDGATVKYRSPLMNSVGVCMDCFEGWYEWGITNPKAIKMRSDLHRAGTPSETIAQTLRATFQPGN